MDPLGELPASAEDDSVGEDVETGALRLGVQVQRGVATMGERTGVGVLEKLNIDLLSDQQPPLGMSPEEWKAGFKKVFVHPCP